MARPLRRALAYLQHVQDSPRHTEGCLPADEIAAVLTHITTLRAQRDALVAAIVCAQADLANAGHDPPGADACMVCAVRAAVERGTVQRSPVSGVVVASLLDIDLDDLNAMYTRQAVNGVVGTTVAGALCTRFGLDELEPLGRQLAEQGVLTEAEGRWLDDQG